MSTLETIKRSPWFTVAVLSCLGLVVEFDETMILPAIPEMIHKFGISYSTSSWLLSAYIIAAAVMTPIGGKLADIYGKKKILLLVMTLYIIGVAFGRFAFNIELMLAARAMQGVGMAMFPIAFGIIREILPENKFTLGQTVFGSTFPAGAIIGLGGGAVIIQNFGWPTTFAAILPTAVALWIVIFRLVSIPNSTKKTEDSQKTRLDLSGTIALAATIILFLSAVTFLETGTIYLVGSLFVASVASLTVFIFVEKKAGEPLLDFKLLKNRNFLPSTIILLLTFFSIFMVYITIPIMVRSPKPLGFGGDALAVASVQLPFMIVFLVGTLASGFVLDKIKNTRLTLIGTIIATLGFVILLGFNSTPETVSLGLTVLAVGLSLSITGGFNTILISVPVQMTGIALGIALLLDLVGMSVGPVIAGIIQQLHQGSIKGITGQFPTHEAYNSIFIVAIAISAISIVLALMANKVKASQLEKTA